MKAATDRGYELKTKKFYDHNEVQGNFLSEVTGYFKHMVHFMGGNYGLASCYIYVKGNKVCRMQYYGDSSANIELIREFGSDEELGNILDAIERDHVAIREKVEKRLEGERQLLNDWRESRKSDSNR